MWADKIKNGDHFLFDNFYGWIFDLILLLDLKTTKHIPLHNKLISNFLNEASRCTDLQSIPWRHWLDNAFVYVRCVHEPRWRQPWSVVLIAFMLKQGAVIQNQQLKLKHRNIYFKYINCVLVLLVPFNIMSDLRNMSTFFQDEHYVDLHVHYVNYLRLHHQMSSKFNGIHSIRFSRPNHLKDFQEIKSALISNTSPILP
jgi:hypothetical protein